MEREALVDDWGTTGRPFLCSSRCHAERWHRSLGVMKQVAGVGQFPRKDPLVNIDAR